MWCMSRLDTEMKSATGSQYVLESSYFHKLLDLTDVVFGVVCNAEKLRDHVAGFLGVGVATT